MNAELKRRLFSSILLVGFLSAPLAGQVGRGPQDSDRVDFPSARQEIQGFESAINNVINAAFTSPFALNQKVKGAYLPGYGFSFNFLVNIHRALVNTPFGQIKSGAQITPEQKKRRIEELKKKLVRTLFDSGESLRQLPRGEAVTIVAFFEDRNFPDEPNENKTIVLTVLKRDLDELGHREDRLREFEQRVKIVEY